MNSINLFSFLRKKKQEPTCCASFADLHTHFLPGVDDGFHSIEDSLEALDFWCRMGIEHVALTPHIMADYSVNKPAFLRDRFTAYSQAAAGIDVDLRLAAEYMLDESFKVHLEEGLLTIDGKHLLVEISTLSPPNDLFEKLYDLQLMGYIPVLAHPERYMFTMAHYQKLKDRGCLFQLNLFSLTGFYGSLPAKAASLLLKKELYDFAGTDVHSLNYNDACRRFF